MQTSVNTIITFINLTTGETEKVSKHAKDSMYELTNKMYNEKSMVPMDWYFSTLPGAAELMQKYIKMGFVLSDFLSEDAFVQTKEGFRINYNWHRWMSVLHDGSIKYSRLYDAIHAMKDSDEHDDLMNNLEIMYIHNDVVIKPIKMLGEVQGTSFMKQFYETLLPYVEAEFARNNK